VVGSVTLQAADQGDTTTMRHSLKEAQLNAPFAEVAGHSKAASVPCCRLQSGTAAAGTPRSRKPRTLQGTSDAMLLLQIRSADGVCTCWIKNTPKIAKLPAIPGVLPVLP